MAQKRQQQHSDDPENGVSRHGNGHGNCALHDSLEENAANELSGLLPKQDNTQQHDSTYDVLSYSRRLLYLSHLFSQFSEVCWQFSIILFLAAFANYKSLILVSTFGLFTNGSVVLFGYKVGGFVDQKERLYVARLFILSQNMCVLVASGCCYLLLAKVQSDDTPTDTGSPANAEHLSHRFDGIPCDWMSLMFLFGIHILGAAAMVLDKGFLVAIERDWIVVMSSYAPAYFVSTSGSDAADNNSKLTTDKSVGKKWLSETNVTMKQIDLSCKVAAPAVAGFLIAALDDGSDPHHGSDLRGATILVGAINCASLVVEYLCTARIYQVLPALSMKRVVFQSTNNSDNTQIAHPEDPNNNNNSGGPSSILSRLRIPKGLRIYFGQSISMGGFSLALLYLNVLTFGAIMTAYLVWRGMRLETVGVWRGVSSAVGLLGTFVYSISAKRMSQMDTGMWSVTLQFVCLSMSYASLFVEQYFLSMILLITGVCSSRIGLWNFDIAITCLMQEYTPEDIRGVVGGVQQSLNSFFFLLSFGLGLIFPDPTQFHLYGAAGYAAVGLSMFLYYIQIYAKRESFIGQSL